jgi:hypothetical protein
MKKREHLQLDQLNGRLDNVTPFSCSSLEWAVYVRQLGPANPQKHVLMQLPNGLPYTSNAVVSSGTKDVCRCKAFIDMQSWIIYAGCIV